MTGFSRKVHRQIRQRDDDLCRYCGAPGGNVAHRIGLGAGGTSRPEVNEVSNGVVLCGMGNVSGCHRWADTDPEAVELGWSIRRWDTRHPSDIPLTDIHGRTFYLTRDGHVRAAETTGAALRAGLALVAAFVLVAGTYLVGSG